MTLPKDVELNRLTAGACSDAPPAPFNRFEIFVDSEGSAGLVLQRARDVLTRILQAHEDAWPSDTEWAALLPTWFVSASAAERTQQEAQAWLDHLNELSPEQREAEIKNARWSVGSFVYWFEPERRDWWWWGAEVMGEDRLVICLAVVEDSPMHEALDWLFRAAGASAVVDEDVRALMIRDGEHHW